MDPYVLIYKLVFDLLQRNDELTLFFAKHSEEEEEALRQQEAAIKAKYQARQHDREHPSSPVSQTASVEAAPRPSMDQQ